MSTNDGESGPPRPPPPTPTPAPTATDAPPPGFIPTRHRKNYDQVGRLRRALSWVMPGIHEPDDARWRQIGEALLHGDEPADRLVAWMFASGMRAARAQFEQALERGIDSLPDAPQPLREFFALVDTPPPWLDWDRQATGAEVYRRGGIELVYVARDVAFLGGYQASAFNKTLLLTGALTKGPTRRLAETLRWALDSTAEGGMRRFGAGFKSTVRVRLIHALVRRHVSGLPSWQLRDWGLPINQIDMAATLLGAASVPLLGARVLGMLQTRHERDAATHSARYLGWLMGVDERWLPTDEASAMRLLYELLLSIYNPDETSVQLAQPMADEPLSRPYPRWAGLRGRFDRARHLSISRLFLGRRGLSNLGLQATTLPWYPLLNWPRCAARHLLSRVLPGGKARAARAGRQAQEDFLQLLSGGEHAVIGHATLAGGT